MGCSVQNGMSSSTMGWAAGGAVGRRAGGGLLGAAALRGLLIDTTLPRIRAANSRAWEAFMASLSLSPLGLLTHCTLE